MKRFVRSGDVVFPVVMLLMVIVSLHYGDGALNTWPMIVVIGCLWFVSARRSRQ